MGRRANQPTFFVDRVTVAAAGTAEQAPNHPIPDGFGVIVRALVTNTDVLFVALTQANAQGTGAADRARLNPGDVIDDLRISNTNVIWANPSVNGEGYELICEGPGAA